ncbi:MULTISPECIES: DUF2306 domain-containing protein [unclassified Acidovorax]|uniref:DUF2306 domain-containing protein n=1 Tax=unclassified Acidovorax TaxID=2684926 RepID=UPI001C4411EB|nr:MULTISPECIES: DUF2306 domain-containing protein [unclassified Acidovorax]MBV7427940.1 DUF2306 domain-containing protein [Acidovorax sp. sif0732]MBV7449197.1 DUF2306 domain-containing protein [Acidovorax sp. sif0715]
MSPRTLAPALAWGLLALSALAVGIVSLRYALPGMPFPMDLPSLQSAPRAFVVHAVSASLALMLGPLQLMAAWRTRFPALHRWVGRGYVAAIAVGWLSSLPLALDAMTGPVAVLGFLALGVAWIVAAGMGLLRALQRRFAEHRRWMVRSYALTAAAITLRVYLGGSMALGVDEQVSYPFIAWLCWVPNLLGAEWYLRRQALRAGRLQRSPPLASL